MQSVKHRSNSTSSGVLKRAGGVLKLRLFTDIYTDIYISVYLSVYIYRYIDPYIYTDQAAPVEACSNSGSFFAKASTFVLVKQVLLYE